MIRARADKSKIKCDYLNLYFNPDCFNTWKNFIFNRATIENIGADQYSTLPVVVPPIDQQVEIMNFIDEQLAAAERAMEQQESQIEKLKEYKTTLINSAVTGRIKVVLGRRLR